MKLKVQTKDLRDALDKLSNIPGSHGGSIFTQAVRFEAGLNGLTMLRFTVEAKISVTLDGVEIEDEGGLVSVDHGALSTLVARLPGEEILISTDDKKMALISGKAKAALNIFGEEAEAEPPEVEMETQIVKLPIEDVRNYFTLTAPAMSKESARPTLCGVCIREMGGKLHFIGSDGKRCHIAITPHKLNKDCIVSSSGVEAILRAIQSETGECTLAVGESTLSVIGSNVEISVALLAGKFPSMENFLNQPDGSILSRITIQRDELTEALKNCSSVGVGDAKVVALKIARDELTLIADNQLDSRMEITVDCNATNVVDIAVPSLQLVTILELMNSDEKGAIELIHYFGTLFVRQADRIAFVGLSRIEIP